MNSDYGTFRRHIWAIPFEVGMLLGVGLTLTQHNWQHLLISLFTLTVSFAPLVFERIFKVRLPASFQFTYVAFIFLSMFSGEVLRLYARIWPWDAGIHFLSGILISFGILLWLRRLLQNKQRVRMTVWLQYLFVFALSVAVATVWEMVEFASDRLFGTKSQDNSLVDTMFDVLLGTGGTLLLLLGYMLHEKGRRIPGIARALAQFDPLNPLK